MRAAGIVCGDGERGAPRTHRSRREPCADDALSPGADAAAAAVARGKIAGVWPAEFDIADRQLYLAEVGKCDIPRRLLTYNFVPEIQSLRQNRSDRGHGPVQQE